MTISVEPGPYPDCKENLWKKSLERKFEFYMLHS